MKEIFKDIPGYECAYQISNLCIVKSLKFGKERILKQTEDIYGYLFVILCKNGKLKNWKIHQLMMMTFKGHKPCGMKLVVNHINFIKTDNRLCNLEVVTSRENSNRKHLKSSSQYTGVSLPKNVKKWRALIRINGKSKHLGMFINEFDAHLAYQKELAKLK